MWRGVVAMAALAVVAGCGAARPEKPSARLQVVAQPDDAVVYVDDRFVGSARVLERRPQPLSTGTHRVTIRAPGHFPHDLEVDLRPGTTRVDIELRPIPP